MASDEIRNLSHRPAPAFFDDSSFEVAIEIFLDTFHVADEYDIDFDFDTNINNDGAIS